ncbi:MAG: ABC transporter permease [Gemmatimonadetes bacterium]|jgi:ABC-2 type transport system permease protein|nr:ABC transporter permease [Gemmatimonadota bacterium]
MNHLRLIYVFFRIGILNELAYRVNFYVQFLQSILSLGMAVAGLAVVFAHTDTLSGWSADEILALLGVFLLVGGFIQMVVQPGMEALMEGVRMGTLDFTLTKPEDAQFLVSIGQIRIWKVADVLLGGAVICAALVRLGVGIGIGDVMLFLLMLLCGCAIIYSFWLILATLSFWFIRIDNILHIFQSMYEAGRWPISLYPEWLRYILTFLVPVAFAVTVPAQALSGRLTGTTILSAVLLACAMLLLSRWFWKLGVKSYAGASA